MSAQKEAYINANKTRVAEMTVSKLRDELASRSLNTKGIKAKLLERLMEALEDEYVSEEEVEKVEGESEILNQVNTTGGNENINKVDGDGQHAKVIQKERVITTDNYLPPFEETEMGKQWLKENQARQDSEVAAKSADVRENENPSLQGNIHQSRTSDAAKEHTDDAEDLPKIKLSSGIFEESTNESVVEDEAVSVVKSGELDLTGDSKDMGRETSENNMDDDILIVEEQGSSSIGDEPETTLELTIPISETTRDSINISSGTVDPDHIVDAKKSTGSNSKTDSIASRETTSPRVSEDNSTGSSSNSNVQTLLVTGFAATTRASAIRDAFRKFGKISGVKIISNSRADGSSRFAHVTILTKDDAETCIKALNKSVLYGHTVNVERVKSNALEFVKELNSKRPANSSEAKSKKGNATEDGTSTAASGGNASGKSDAEAGPSREDKPEISKSDESKVTKEAKQGRSDAHVEKLEPKLVSTDRKSDKGGSSSSKPRGDDKHGKSTKDERPHRPVPQRRTVEVRLRPYRPYEGGRTYYTGSKTKTFRGPPYDSDRSDRVDKIRRNRDDVEKRDAERRRYHQERKQREEKERQRAIERKNELELRKLEEERRKLRREREKVELEKLELIRLEKMRQQHERERIEEEKEELRRATAKLAQKRSLGAEKERGRYDYPEAKKSHVESHRIVPSSHSQAEFSRRSDSRQETTRRVESGRHERGGLRVEVDFDERSRGRPREREHGRRSTSREKRGSSRTRDKVPEYALPRAPKPPMIGKPVERVARDYDRKEYSNTAHASGSRPESYRAANAPVEPWARSTYATSSGQPVGREVWSSSSRKPALVSNERQVRVDPGIDRWGAANAPGPAFVNRASPSLLNQHVLNPHAGSHMGVGGVLPGSHTHGGFSPYKMPPVQYRRY